MKGKLGRTVGVLFETAISYKSRGVGAKYIDTSQWPAKLFSHRLLSVSRRMTYSTSEVVELNKTSKGDSLAVGIDLLSVEACMCPILSSVVQVFALLSFRFGVAIFRFDPGSSLLHSPAHVKFSTIHATGPCTEVSSHLACSIHTACGRSRCTLACTIRC